MASNPVITQSPTPLVASTQGQVTYTDLSYNIIPDISNNPTYTLRTNETDPTYDVFTSSTSAPQAFIPNSLFISTNLISPAGIARDSLGNFYVANSDGFPTTISVYDSAGVYLPSRTITLNSGAIWFSLRYLVFDTSDNLYVSGEVAQGIAYVAAGATTNDPSKTIFGPPSTYRSDCRGLAYLAPYLYIAIKTSPGSVIKYNVSDNKYLVLDMSGNIGVGGAPNALTYNPLYTSSPTPFLYLTSTNFQGAIAGQNKIFGISQITGTEDASGNPGTATITLLTSFNDTQYPYSIVADNTGNLYSGLAINNSLAIGQIARTTSAGTISNISNMSLSSSGPIVGRPYGLLFDGSLNLYVTDLSSSRVIKSQPKTFVFGGPSSVVNPSVNTGSSTPTYLYDTSSATSATNFTLNIASSNSSNPVITQSPTPLQTSTLGQVTYTDLSYNIIPDISNNPTYTLRTNASDPTYDVFSSSTSVPQAFIPNSLFISSNLSSPTGIAQDSNGFIYVANEAPNTGPATISVYNSLGAYSRTITLTSDVSGQVWVRLRFLTFDPSNNLYVSGENPGLPLVGAGGVAYVAADASTNTFAKTIFPYPNTYVGTCRGLSYYNNFLYISIRNNPPPAVIKYDVSSGNYVVLDVSGVVIGGMSDIVRNPFYVSSPTPFLYLAASLNAGTGDGGIVSISEITGTPLPSPGGTGSATISTFVNFGSSYSAWSVVVDNSANLYAGIQPVTIGGEIARVTSTGDLSNISRITLDSSAIGIPRGLLFDGSLNLYVTDVTNNRVIKSQPKTFVFGGPSIVNPILNFNPSTTTYLYDTSNTAVITSFDLNISCFKKGTKILCENEIYIPIEELKTGDLVKTYKHGYQKVIVSVHSRLCDYVQSVSNQLYTYSREKNPDLIEDLHLTGGHSLLVDGLTEYESNDMKQINWAQDEFFVEDKYKLLACFSRQLYIATEQHADIYHFTLEPPENAKSNYVYGVYANGILAESCSKGAMETDLGKSIM
jgi:hypothetical protein